MKNFLNLLVVMTSLAGLLMIQTMTSQADEPKQGGVLIYLDKHVHNNLYPPAGSWYSNGGILNQITDRLTWQNPGTLVIEPWLAESWQINDDATIYTFKIRPDITFSDGSPLDAIVIAKNFDTYGLGNKKLRQPISEVINNYDHSEVLDPLTVRFYFKKSSPGFLQATSIIASGIVSLKTLDLSFDQTGDATKMIGSGPFYVTQETLGKELVLKVRKDYNWAPMLSKHQGRAYLDELKYLTVPEDSVRIGALIAGQANFIRQLEAYDEARVESSGNIVYAPGTRGVNNSINFRPDNFLVADIRVRKALLFATNREDIIKTLYSKNYPIAKSIMAHDTYGYSDLSAKLSYDPKKANELLDEAGWVKDEKGIREKDGKKLILTIYESGPQPQSKAMLQLIAQQWLRVGVLLNVKTADGAHSVIDDLDPEKVPVAPEVVGRADPDALKSQYYPKNRDILRQKGGVSEKSKTFIDDKLNGFLEEITTQPNAEKRQEIMRQASEYLIDQAYTIPLFEEPQVYGGSAKLKGVEFEAVGRPTFYNTWIDQ